MADTSATNPGTSLNPATALDDMGQLFHGIAQGLNYLFWIFQPGQGWRFIIGVGGVVSGVGAAKLYTSPSVTNEKSAAFSGAILLTGVTLLCLYMTLRAWPVDPTSKHAIRPAAYVVMILKGEKPPAGPAMSDNTDAIQLGLEAIASIWVVSKVAQGISGIAGAAGALGGIWGAIKKIFSGGGETGGGAPEIPPIEAEASTATLSVPNYPGLTTEVLWPAN